MRIRAELRDGQHWLGAAVCRAEQRGPFVEAPFQEQLVDRGAERRIELATFPLRARHGGAEAVPELRLERAERDRTAAAADVHAVARAIAAEHVFRWPRAMAQFEVGHGERMARIAALRKELPGLALAGNAYRGIGVPDCVATGAAAIAELAG